MKASFASREVSLTACCRVAVLESAETGQVTALGLLCSTWAILRGRLLAVLVLMSLQDAAIFAFQRLADFVTNHGEPLAPISPNGAMKVPRYWVRIHLGRAAVACGGAIHADDMPRTVPLVGRSCGGVAGRGIHAGGPGADVVGDPGPRAQHLLRRWGP